MPENIAVIEMDKFLNELDKRFENLQLKNEKPTFAPMQEWHVTLKKASEITGTPIATFKNYIRSGLLNRNQVAPGGILYLSPNDIRKAIEYQKKR